jgi:hypothetical protein
MLIPLKNDYDFHSSGIRKEYRILAEFRRKKRLLEEETNCKLLEACRESIYNYRASEIIDNFLKINISKTVSEAIKECYEELELESLKSHY